MPTLNTRPPEMHRHLLSVLERKWRQYPHLRFGQLLNNIVAEESLFYMSDENLLKHIEEYNLNV